MMSNKQKPEDVPGALDMRLWNDFGIGGYGSMHEIRSDFVRRAPRLVPGFRSKPIWRVQSGRSEISP